MVRISIFGLCVLLSLPVSGQNKPAVPPPEVDQTPLPRLTLKREHSRTDAQGIRCIVGTSIYTSGDAFPDLESFVERSEKGVLPEGLYFGASAMTSNGLRLLITKPLTPDEWQKTFAETKELTPAEMDAAVRASIAAPFVIDTESKNVSGPQIQFGVLDEHGCGMHEANDNPSHPPAVGHFEKIVVSIEGVPTPESQPASAPKPREPKPFDPRDLVVNVQTAKGQSIGAGVVLGITGNRLYIVTAQHVVWSDNAKMRDVTVSFFSPAGEPFPVTVLDFSNETLDVAVLSIPTDTDKLPEFGKLAVGNPRELVRGATVRSIGHPGGVLWKLAATPEKFSRRASSALEFDSLIADSGSSGGALFNACDALIGITKRAGASTGIAAPIDYVLDQLAEWNIEIATTTTAPCVEK